jgi:hypothetical protein
MTHVIVDIESRIDKSLLRRVRYPQIADGPEADEQAYQFEAATLRERQDVAKDEMPWFPYQWHVPISIGVAPVNEEHELGVVETVLADQLPGTVAHWEKSIIEEFWRRFEAFRERKGILVTFNGRRFDIPVLELAALKHGVPTPVTLGEKYGVRHRYAPEAHLDLLDFLANYATYTPQGGLDFFLTMLGYPGKGAVNGGDVQGLYDQGLFEEIHRYCRDDVRRTYRLFLHVQVWRGLLDPARARELAQAVKMEAE